ncbi:hypothetical protein QFC19_001040 [Naganishia cerealis]|uniref:Uncharacterized protein n=1 Tax=Naganishia cerealis TaxID=610337 RepID=A0ACC2WJS3_9TREE|nr:hypothetical protein QFC19_001040 [Naganishia cerealis]
MSTSTAFIRPSESHAGQSSATRGSVPPSASGESSSHRNTSGFNSYTRSIDVSLLKNLAKDTLLEALTDIQGQKTLVLDKALSGPLGLVTDVSLLKLIIDQIKTHQKSNNPLPTSPGSTGGNAEASTSHQHHTYTILCTPRVTSLCRKVLEDLGVSGDVELREYRLEWVGLEDDLLSLEMEDVARDIYLSDPATYGDLELSNHVDSLIIIDRSVDWVTPMCTQLTFEGLLDEYVGVKNSHIEVDPALISPNASDSAPATSNSTDTLGRVPAPSKKRKHHLSGSNDSVFADIRDLNFATVGARLSKIAKRLEGDYEARKALKNVKEMKDFVGRMLADLSADTGLSEILMPITRSEEFSKILEIQQSMFLALCDREASHAEEPIVLTCVDIIAGYNLSSQLDSIESLMNQEIPAMLVLRAAVLLHLAQGGIRQKMLENFKREFLQASLQIGMNIMNLD